MFISGSGPVKVSKFVNDIRKAATRARRDAESIRIVIAVAVIIDDTDEKAQAKYRDYLSYVDEEVLALFGGCTGQDLSKFSDDDDFKFTGPALVQSLVSLWSDTVPGNDGLKRTKSRLAIELSIGEVHPRIVGSPKTVADWLQNWYDMSGVDGFNPGGAISADNCVYLVL
ncbi:hypothetical protein NM208_g8181 [Fusarium decemcellulare]|uniref:Uncharacterized protein n=1 Tax=Fusarium decemcellulare TaxID=57161 RepID=A0ACC1S6E1_9HYPO|nr:hypothetical protein NM208_g8181 [Fusarium decemcellulare]